MGEHKAPPPSAVTVKAVPPPGAARAGATPPPQHKAGEAPPPGHKGAREMTPRQLQLASSVCYLPEDPRPHLNATLADRTDEMHPCHRQGADTKAAAAASHWQDSRWCLGSDCHQTTRRREHSQTLGTLCTQARCRRRRSTRLPARRRLRLAIRRPTRRRHRITRLEARRRRPRLKRGQRRRRQATRVRSSTNCAACVPAVQ